MLMQQKREYFPILDAFRFFAFFRIFLLHIPFFEGNSFFFKIMAGGEIGVDFFFVLSGFLITYLFIKEKKERGNIDGRRYFLRRTLRIWPLYFLAITIAFAGLYFSNESRVAYNNGYKPNLFTLLTFTENYRMIFTDSFPDGVPLRVLWSICVEEHFYILWLLLFTIIKPHQIIKSIAVLWSIGILYRIGIYILYPDKTVYDPDLLSKMDYFCSGALAACLFSNYPTHIRLAIKRIPRSIKNIFTVLIIAAFFFWQFTFEISRKGAIIFPIISAAMFGMLLLLTVSSENFINKNYKGIFSKLGKISYGLYVYHTIVIILLLKLSVRFQVAFNSSTLLYIFFCLASLAGSIIVSIFSFRYFEMYFLKKKP